MHAVLGAVVPPTMFLRRLRRRETGEQEVSPATYIRIVGIWCSYRSPDHLINRLDTINFEDGFTN